MLPDAMIAFGNVFRLGHALSWRQKEFDPNQARDESGRWTETGGNGGQGTGAEGAGIGAGGEGEAGAARSGERGQRGSEEAFPRTYRRGDRELPVTLHGEVVEGRKWSLSAPDKAGYALLG